METLRSTTVSTKQQRIAQLAREAPEMAFTTLAHHIDLDWMLEAIYEQDFLNCSYGFRPGGSAHQALDTLWRQATAMGGGWVLEIDIQKFFDTLDHAAPNFIVHILKEFQRSFHL